MLYISEIRVVDRNGLVFDVPCVYFNSRTFIKYVTIVVELTDSETNNAIKIVSSMTEKFENLYPQLMQYRPYGFVISGTVLYDRSAILIRVDMESFKFLSMVRDVVEIPEACSEYYKAKCKLQADADFVTPLSDFDTLFEVHYNSWRQFYYCNLLDVVLHFSSGWVVPDKYYIIAYQHTGIRIFRVDFIDVDEVKGFLAKALTLRNKDVITAGKGLLPELFG